MGLMNVAYDIKDDSRLKQNYLVGKVVDNDDSKTAGGKRQRVKLRVKGLHDGIPDSDLPWMLPHQTGYANAAGGQMGNVRIPPIGAEMHALFDGDDPHSAFYKHPPTTKKATDKNPILKDNYPYRRGEVDAHNNMYYFDDKTGEFQYHRKDGTKIIMKDGDVTVVAGRNMRFSSKGDMSQSSGGNMTVHGAKTTSIKGKTIQENGPDGSVPADQVEERPEIDMHDDGGSSGGSDSAVA